jgi:hypothetical protein
LAFRAGSLAGPEGLAALGVRMARAVAELQWLVFPALVAAPLALLAPPAVLLAQASVDPARAAVADLRLCLEGEADAVEEVQAAPEAEGAEGADVQEHKVAPDGAAYNLFLAWRGSRSSERIGFALALRTTTPILP